MFCDYCISRIGLPFKHLVTLLYEPIQAQQKRVQNIVNIAKMNGSTTACEKLIEWINNDPYGPITREPDAMWMGKDVRTAVMQ